MSIRAIAGATAIRVVSCYAPQPGCPIEEQDNFWSALETHTRSIDASDLLLVGGDLNGHVGNSRDGFERVHGGCGHGTRNEAGERALECAEACDLALANTYPLFSKKCSC